MSDAPSLALGLTRDTNEWVELPEFSRFQGTYIIGRPGMGKSSLLKSMMKQDIAYQYGFCLLDPHGELFDFVAACTETKQCETVLLDASDTAYPFGLNLFDCQDASDPLARSMTVAHVLGIFRKLWGEHEGSWGPRLETLLRAITILMLDNPGMTLVEVPTVLYDDDFRQMLMSNLIDHQTRLWWENEYGRMSERDRREFRASTINRVSALVANPIVRNIVGQSGTTVDVASVMAREMVMLVKLPVGVIGEDACSLLGSIIVRDVLQATMSRARTRDTTPFFLYADEYHRFATPDFATLIEEARKYYVGVTIAHQRREQLDAQHRSSPLSSVNLVVFQVLGHDAEEVVDEFSLEPQPGEPKLEMVTTPAYRTWTETYWDPPEAEQEYAETARAITPLRHRVSFLEKLGLLPEHLKEVDEAAIRLLSRQFNVPDYVMSFARRSMWDDDHPMIAHLIKSIELFGEDISLPQEKEGLLGRKYLGRTRVRVLKRHEDDEHFRYRVWIDPSVQSAIEHDLKSGSSQIGYFAGFDPIVDEWAAELRWLAAQFRRQYHTYWLLRKKVNPDHQEFWWYLELSEGRVSKLDAYHPRSWTGGHWHYFFSWARWEVIPFEAGVRYLLDIYSPLRKELDRLEQQLTLLKGYQQERTLRQFQGYHYPVRDTFGDPGIRGDVEDFQRYRWIPGPPRPLADLRLELANSLSNLPPYQARVRLRGANGMEEHLIYTPLRDPCGDSYEEQRQTSRMEYGQPVAEVTAQIAGRATLTPPVESTVMLEEPAKREVTIRRRRPL